MFEFVSGDIGAQSTVCGGGRYDGLVKSMGGPDIPALGFAMGIERLMLTLQNTNAPFPEEDKCDLYIATLGDNAQKEATKICNALRSDGYEAGFDICNRGLKAQMKYADKIGALYTMVLGDNEIASGEAKLKCMENGEETTVKLSELSDTLFELKCKSVF